MTTSSNSGELGPDESGAPAPVDRMDWLTTHDIFETLAEERFESLTELAQKFLDVENAAMDGLAEDRRYVAVCSGECSGQEKILREQSLCSITVASDELLVVEDVRRADFLDAPETFIERGILSYAGVTLGLNNGMVLGTFCVFDSNPRIFSGEELMNW